MRHFTLFTFLYLAAGVCLTLIALQHPDITPNLKTTLLVNAGWLYLTTVASTFPFWRQGVLRSQAILRDQAAWRRNFVMITPWIVIASALVQAIRDLVNHNWTTEAIAGGSLWLVFILLSAEQIFIRSQIRQSS